MTFSIAGRCGRTGQFGIAISSSSPAVAARCTHLRPGVGAVCSQNVTDPRLGPAVLDGLRQGAAAALAGLAGREHLPFRQVTAIGPTGPGAFRSGERTLGVHAGAVGTDCVAAGNMLGDPDVPAAMIAAFAAAECELGARLMAGLQAGLAAGGEAGPVRSAGLAVVGAVPWAITDLRVDWDDDPIGRLAALWTVWAPQSADYLTRALDPTRAPSYGVPGDR